MLKYVAKLFFVVCVGLIIFSGVSLHAATSSIGYAQWTNYDGQGTTPDRPNAISYLGKMLIVVRGSNNVIYSRWGTQDLQTWSSWVADPNGGMTPSPIALAVFNNSLYESVRGLTDNKIYTRYTTFDDDLHWSSWQVDPVSYTPDMVSLFVFDNQLYQTARGTGNAIFTRSSSDGATFSNWSENGGTTPNAIATTVFANQIFQAVRGLTDSKIYTRDSYDGIYFSNWTRDDSSYTPDAVDMCSVPLYEGSVLGPTNYIIQMAQGTGSRMYYREQKDQDFDAYNWSQWYYVDETDPSPYTYPSYIYAGSTPSCTSAPVENANDNNIFIVVRGTNGKIFWTYRHF